VLVHNQYSLPRPAIFVQEKVFIPGTKNVGMALTLAWNDGSTENPIEYTTAAKVYIGDSSLAQHGTARAIAAAIESILPGYLEWIEEQLNNEWEEKHREDHDQGPQPDAEGVALDSD
jgi:hypothetical protein